MDTWHSVFERPGPIRSSCSPRKLKTVSDTSRWIKETVCGFFLFLANPRWRRRAWIGELGYPMRPARELLLLTESFPQSPRRLSADFCAVMSWPTSVHSPLIFLSSLSLTRGPISISISVDPPQFGHHPRARRDSGDASLRRGRAKKNQELVFTLTFNFPGERIQE